MAQQIQFVRHGEVDNPGGVLYGRLDGFGLTDRGARMATMAAEALLGSGRPVARVLSSPLQRALESAAPVTAALKVPLEIEPDLIEASSKLEGGQFAMKLSILAKPAAWPYLINPFRPSWGESFVSVHTRTRDVFSRLRETGTQGDVVLVGHQLPIWLMHRGATGKPLFHDPRKRRCGLSSITSFEWRDDELIEVDYREPAKALYAPAVDVGAV
jgi:broad specificity phosphatase PhoE